MAKRRLIGRFGPTLSSRVARFPRKYSSQQFISRSTHHWKFNKKCNFSLDISLLDKKTLLILLKEAKELFLLFEERMKPKNSHRINDPRQVCLPDGSNLIHLQKDSVHKTVGFVCYFQCGQENARNNAILQLFCQTISESAFNTLRTKEQLGYIVSSSEEGFSGVHGKSTSSDLITKNPALSF